MASTIPNQTTVLTPNFKEQYLISKNKEPQQEIYALTKRLVTQGWRRPSILITGIIQPLLWLLLFSALFQNAPVGLLTVNEKYGDFISSGIIVFTAFTCSLNAGLPLIFDREFGFLNRLLSSPISSRYCIVYSSSFNIILTSSIQVISIMYTCLLMGNSIPSLESACLITITLLLISNSITNISLILAFILPGHVEFLACLLIINLPLLFSSTALAPLVFMPSWLQIIASINPLSYAIEIIRYAYLNNSWNYNSQIMKTVWGPLNILMIMIILLLINTVLVISIPKLISNKFEE